MDSKQSSKGVDSQRRFLVVLGMFLGAAAGVFLTRLIGVSGVAKKTPLPEHVQPQAADMSVSKSENHRKPAYIADVYFTLASVVQGVTVAVLGEALFNHIHSASEISPIVILVAFDSLIIIVLFWFAFMIGYFYLFRVVTLRARDHLVLTLVYFSVGFVQVIAFQFIEYPRTWLSAIFAMLLILVLYRAYGARLLRKQQADSTAARVLYVRHQPLNIILNIISLIIAILVILWHLVPSLHNWQYEMAALTLFNLIILVASISGVRAFQSRLDTLR